MKYYIQRGINEYGPYTLADLQRYVAQGNILMTDLTRSEGMTEWVPVSQILGNIALPPPAAPPVPATPAAGGTVYSGTPAYSAAPAYGGTPAYAVGAAPAAVPTGPVPPDLHWALVLVIGMFCGFFSLVWLFIEASFVKKLKPESNFLAFLIAAIGVSVGSVILFYAGIIAMVAANPNNPQPPVIPFVILVSAQFVAIALQIVGVFKMRAILEEYYNTVEPINLRLSGVMTFFFALFYFQYHFSRIANWKKTGYLLPQQ
jgi:hypothetical protein